MGKFCTQCGTQIEEGQICSCQRGVQHTIPQTAATVEATPGMHMSQSVKVVQVEGYLKKLIDSILKILKAPDTELSSFTRTADSKLAMGFMGVHGLIFAVYMVLMFRKLNSWINSYAGPFSGYLSTTDDLTNVSKMIEFPMVNIFIMSFVMTVVLGGILAGILMGVDKLLFKQETTYGHMLCAASGRSVALLPVILVAIVVGLISPAWGIMIWIIGEVFGFFFVGNALKGASKISADKQLYCLFLSVIAFLVVAYFVERLVYPAFLPESLNQVINEIKAAGMGGI